MKEKINIVENNGSLKLIGGKNDSALYLNNEIIQFTYLREIGSTWRYQVAKGIQKNDIIKENSFSNFVKHGYITSDSLSKQFSYILSILANGVYELEIIDLNNKIDVVEIDRTKNGYYENDEYGGIVGIIETQNCFDNTIVDNYVDIIKNGSKPIAILLKIKDSNNTFIIDGHHKIVAYNKLNQKAKCLLITKINSEEIDIKKGLEILDKCKIKNNEFRKRFLEK